MGYSLSVKFKSKKEQDKMYSFYLSIADIIKKMSDSEGLYNFSNYSDLKRDKNLSYAPKHKYLLGYDGPSSKAYYFELILAWMSIKSQYRDKTKNPFFYHDDFKVYVTQDNDFFINVDEKGIQSIEKSLFLYNNNKFLRFNLYAIEDPNTYFKTIYEFFIELETRWNAYS